MIIRAIGTSADRESEVERATHQGVEMALTGTRKASVTLPDLQ